MLSFCFKGPVLPNIFAGPKLLQSISQRTLKQITVTLLYRHIPDQLHLY